jgi:hypothetical protein
MWYRIFGTSPVMPQPAELQKHFGWGEIVVRGDDLGWTSLESGALRIERFLTEADDIRNDLDTWAAWLEQQENNPYRLKLMQHVISTRQLLTLQSESDSLGQEIARLLALCTDGVYQVDGQGFFASDGSLMAAEN